MQVLRLLIKLYESVEIPDWVSISQCLLLLDDAPEVAKVIERLLKGSEVCPLTTSLTSATPLTPCLCYQHTLQMLLVV